MGRQKIKPRWIAVAIVIAAFTAIVSFAAIHLARGRAISASGVKTIPVGTMVYAMSVNPTTNTIYAIDAEANAVIVIDGKTSTVSATIPIEKVQADRLNLHSIGVNPITNTIY